MGIWEERNFNLSLDSKRRDDGLHSLRRWSTEAMSHATTSPYQPSTCKPMTAEEQQQTIERIKKTIQEIDVKQKRLDKKLTEQERELGLKP